jgi:hypothetical protein
MLEGYLGKSVDQNCLLREPLFSAITHFSSGGPRDRDLQLRLCHTEDDVLWGKPHLGMTGNAEELITVLIVAVRKRFGTLFDFA